METSVLLKTTCISCSLLSIRNSETWVKIFTLWSPLWRGWGRCRASPNHPPQRWDLTLVLWYWFPTGLIWTPEKNEYPHGFVSGRLTFNFLVGDILTANSPPLPHCCRCVSILMCQTWKIHTIQYTIFGGRACTCFYGCIHKTWTKHIVPNPGQNTCMYTFLEVKTEVRDDDHGNLFSPETKSTHQGAGGQPRVTCIESGNHRCSKWTQTRRLTWWCFYVFLVCWSHDVCFKKVQHIWIYISIYIPCIYAMNMEKKICNTQHIWSR